MSIYYDTENDEIKTELWEINTINREIKRKMLVKSKNTEKEHSTLIKAFNYYDKYNCRHINYENFRKCLNRLGIVSIDNTDEKYIKYFKKLSNGKNYLNYHKFCNDLTNKNIISNNLNENITLSVQKENSNLNSFFHRQNTSNNMNF